MHCTVKYTQRYAKNSHILTKSMRGACIENRENRCFIWEIFEKFRKSVYEGALQSLLSKNVRRSAYIQLWRDLPKMRPNESCR